MFSGAGDAFQLLPANFNSLVRESTDLLTFRLKETFIFRTFNITFFWSHLHGGKYKHENQVLPVATFSWLH